MATLRALTLQTGKYAQFQATDTLDVGLDIVAPGAMSITANGGASAITVGSAAQWASGKGISSAGGVANFDWSGSSGTFKTGTGAVSLNGNTTVTNSGTLTVSGGLTTLSAGLTVSGGAISLTGNAASSLTTSSGALTITSAVAATWSTAAGALTVNGAGGINLQGGGTTALAINSTGTQLTVQAGAIITTTGTGNINLPNNGSARFQIEGSGVSANVTAANLATLTGAGNADALHTHSAAGQTVISGLTTTGLGDGDFGYVSANNVVSKTDSSTATTAYALGANEGTVGSITIGGTIENAKFTTDGGSPSAGAPVYVAATADDSSTGAGKLTATAPSTGIVAEVGLCVDNSNYAGSKTAKIVWQPKPIVIL